MGELSKEKGYKAKSIKSVDTEKRSSTSICPSKEFVDNLLKECGRKLGFDYVINDTNMR